MTDDLDTLRPEVAEAVKGADAAFHHEGLFAEPYWQTIRAELLRLARENKELRDADIFNLDQQLVEYKQRAERAEAELAGVRETIKCLNHRVQVAGAAQAQTAYFIGGPHATAIVHNLHHADRIIEALCECTGDDVDDYTVTDLSTAS